MKLSKNKKLEATILTVIFVIFTGAMVFLMIRSGAPADMRQVKSYDPQGPCQAVNNPECGYCPGKVIAEKCYVKIGELERYE